MVQTNDLLDEFELELDFEYTNWEIINRERVSLLLRDSDILLISQFIKHLEEQVWRQCHVVVRVIMPERGGAHEYVVKGH